MSAKSNLITDGAVVIMQKGDYFQCVKIRSKRAETLGFKKSCIVNFAGAVGHEFGSTFRMVRREAKAGYCLEKMSLAEVGALNPSLAPEKGSDNRNLCDTSSSQTLSRDDVYDMKAQGVKGEELVQAFVSNSATFAGKTVYSQQKYITKKEQKHMTPITVHRPSTDLVADMIYKNSPYKIANLRPDALFQLVSYSNAGPSTRLLVFDSGTMKLVTSALLAATGPQGRVVDVNQGFPNMNGTCMSFMDFSDAQLSAISYLEFEQLAKLCPPLEREEEGEGGLGGIAPSENIAVDVASDGEKNASDAEEQATDDRGHKRKRASKKPSNQVFKMRFVRSRTENERISRAVLTAGATSLVVAYRGDPIGPTMNLWPFLLPGCPVTVFCPYLKPLVGLYETLKLAGALNLHVAETWLREYQVLPERTHPHMNMSGGGGYILRGTKVMVE